MLPAHRLGIDLLISRGDLEGIAIGIGIVVALASIPIGRALFRMFRRQHERRVYLIMEAVTANVRLAIEEDK